MATEVKSKHATSRPEPLRPIRVTCAPGLSTLLQKEMTELGLEVEASDPTGVEVRGRTADAMRITLRSRLAYHVLQRFGDIYAKTVDQIYEAALGLPWERVIPSDGYLSVVSATRTTAERNTMFINMRLKDAIVDRINKIHGRRPDSGPNGDRTVVHLYWGEDRARISLDIAGRKLSDRGYRQIPHKAPMRETIAAAVLMEAHYDGSRPLVIPMCGSGTLAIEAALMATGRAPGLLRANFGIKHLATFDEKTWGDERLAAKKIRNKAEPAPIILSDIDPTSVEAARRNAVTAGVDHLMRFEVCDFAETSLPETPGTIILHGEYGQRLGNQAELAATYRRMGDFLKQSCGGWDAYVFTAKPLAGEVGLRPKRRIPFENGSIDCRLLQFELYSGTREDQESTKRNE
ncbi:MAG: hypothetical protein MK085_07375 [Phycisphaerales bacterium]|nr:hypothetical protein [Phycisphaerales bacterium]